MKIVIKTTNEISDNINVFNHEVMDAEHGKEMHETYRQIYDQSRVVSVMEDGTVFKDTPQTNVAEILTVKAKMETIMN